MNKTIIPSEFNDFGKMERVEKLTLGVNIDNIIGMFSKDLKDELMYHYELYSMDYELEDYFGKMDSYETLLEYINKNLILKIYSDDKNDYLHISGINPFGEKFVSEYIMKAFENNKKSSLVENEKNYGILRDTEEVTEDFLRGLDEIVDLTSILIEFISKKILEKLQLRSLDTYYYFKHYVSTSKNYICMNCLCFQETNKVFFANKEELQLILLNTLKTKDYIITENTDFSKEQGISVINAKIKQIRG